MTTYDKLSCRLNNVLKYLAQEIIDVVHSIPDRILVACD